MKTQLKNRSGEVLRDVEVSDALFALPLTMRLKGLLHQAVVRQRANARTGQASVKTRSEVAGSTRKLFPQKGTGRARMGTIRSPIRRGGGVAFGPRPRSYSQRMPKKMRRLAIRGALSAKAADGRMAIVDDLGFEQPKTKEMVQVLDALKARKSVLLVTPEPREALIKSAGNLDKVKTLPARYLNVYDLLAHEHLVIELEAVRRAEDLWAPGGRTIEEEPAPKPKAKRKPRAKKATAEAKAKAKEVDPTPEPEAVPETETEES
jgi:large subunit ribosomal protein L4